MPTNNEFDRFFYTIGDVPIFTYGMILTTVAVLSYMTAMEKNTEDEDEEDENTPEPPTEEEQPPPESEEEQPPPESEEEQPPPESEQPPKGGKRKNTRRKRPKK